MDKQRVYNDVAAHLLKQGERAVTTYQGHEQCMYKAVNGLRCAIGCLLPVDIDTTDFEGQPVALLLDVPEAREALAKYGIYGDTEDLKFLCGLQRIHDLVDPVNWGGKLTDFANNHDLIA